MSNEKRLLYRGILFLTLFSVWTGLIQVVDVQSIGPMESEVGFAALNCWFHELTGVHMWIYTITDWLGLVPIGICLMFGGLGFIQMIKRKSIWKVDFDIIALGIYYILVILGYLVFEMIPINNRPVLIDGLLEASYPSSTTLLVLSVMLTFLFQINRRLKKAKVKKLLCILTIGFSLFMVIGRLIAGVHWLTDIVGSILLSMGLFFMYQAVVESKKNGEV